LGEWQDPRGLREIVPTPIHPGAPAVPAGRLPPRLSASTFEALRDCPYRFFAQSVLGLRAAEELDPEVEKRDYGQWLHSVLHEFHLGRRSGATVDDDIAALHAIGQASLATQGLDEAAFLPFSASFAVLVPRYVAWLHRREAGGASWSRGEADLRAAPAELGGVELQGRVDRIDAVDGGRRLELIDYKTGSASQLKKKLLDRFEDTQLAFYAALVGAESNLPLNAYYLALDSTQGLEMLEHADVGASAAALVEGVAIDLAPPARGRRPAAARRGSGLRILRGARPVPARPLVAGGRRRGRRRPRVAMSAPAFRIDGVPATRAAFYATACDPARSCAVEACAGSGKTWILVSRMLRALLDGAEPHEILAITFTRAAAGEMRERLSEWLAQYSGPRLPMPSGSRRWCSAASPRHARRRSRPSSRRFTRGAGGGRPIEIRTFHAWFSQLCGSHRWPCSTGSAWRPEMELIEDFTDHLPASDARLPCRRAARSRTARRLRGDDGAARPPPAAQVARRDLVAPGRVRNGRRGRRARRERRIGGRSLARGGALRPSGRGRARRLLAGAAAPCRRGHGTRREDVQDLAGELGAALVSGDARELFEAACHALSRTRANRASLSKPKVGLAETQDELLFFGSRSTRRTHASSTAAWSVSAVPC
jgi:RecB family exonuclease